MIVPSAPHDIQTACRLLQEGQVIGLPTETVYGLAADAFQDKAVARIFEVKNRPTFNPLIIHVASLEDVADLVDISSKAQALMAKFWPGPLTLILPRKKECPISFLASGGLDTLAIRCPAHPLARKLIQTYGRPLAAPSANRSTSISPTSSQDVLASLGNQVPLILEGGPCKIGLESTILDLSDKEPVLLRPGSILKEDIESVIGSIALSQQNESSLIKAPGMMKRHYAPNRPLRLNVTDLKEGEALLGFGSSKNLPITLNLSKKADLTEAATNLFRMLRELDQDRFVGIAVMPIPMTGLGIAMNDRLQRAATPEEKFHTLMAGDPS